MKKKLIALIIVGLGVYLYFAVSGAGDTIVKPGEYIIPSKHTTSDILIDFKIKNLNYNLYKIWQKINYPTASLKIGTYSITKDTTLNTLFSVNLKRSSCKEKEIKILPGWNIFDIDEYLSGTGIIDKGDFIRKSQNIDSALISKYPFLEGKTTLEGFLTPDTYRICVEATTDDIINLLLSTFNDRIYSKYSSLGDKKFYDNLIMASIVEKEERNPENKPIVAGILEKRLNEGSPLGADATVCYAYEKTFKECTPAFIGEKIYIKTKYNTRNQSGLPPTPITNISPDTFEAAVNPESSDYYYYLHDIDGYIHYGKTLTDHVRNKNLYIK